MMLLKRFHDDNESIVALKGSTSIKIGKTSENVGKCRSMEWNRRILETSE